MNTNAPLSTLTVSQLNRHIRSLLENEVGEVHVEGEISNLSKPSSGHFYFTLKDKNAQLRCVFFKNRHNKNTPKLIDGQHVVASGKLSLYEARGDYQLIVDSLSEAGLGQLYQQFELLKKKLEAEGLFKSQFKKKIPSYPNHIAVITSASGAAVRDILATLKRRFPYAGVLIYPCDVQGQLASGQLINAIHQVEQDNRADVIILARGGGSIEDLWAFNEERLARKIAACTLPIVSGVGHETDFTIADFVADLRAATPTAAAEAVTPSCFDMITLFNQFYQQLYSSIYRKIQNSQLRLNHQQQKISSPGKAILSHWQTLDYLEKRLISSIYKIVSHHQHHLNLALSKLHAINPKIKLREDMARLNQWQTSLFQQLQEKIEKSKNRLAEQIATLQAVSPLATLDRGYSIATSKGEILFSSDQVVVGDHVNIKLSQGKLTCEIINKGD